MANVTREFSVDFLENTIDVTYKHAGVVLHEAVDQLRWAVVYRVIFEHEDKFWEITYEEPATEYQEGQDRFESDPVTARQVEAYEKVVLDFRPVEQ